MEQHDQPSHYERINAIKRYIREHLDEPLGRDLLAGLAGFSVPHFHRIFAAHVGESIASYVRRARMERAAQQILAGAPDRRTQPSPRRSASTSGSARPSCAPWIGWWLPM
jgi:AraC-like DNA-binding protein